MRVMVTGGAGYVGSHCVRALCDDGVDVVVLDSLSVGHRSAVDSRATLVVGDLADTSLVKSTFDDGHYDAVMHFAALADVGASVKQPLAYYRNNVGATLTLLEQMRDHDVKSLVFSSTCAVYGVPPSVPIVETTRRRPISPYGRSKLTIEWALEDCAKAWGLASTCLRYFNAAGAAPDGSIGEDHDPETHLIPLVMKVALGQLDAIKVYGVDYATPDGSCVRDYVHVSDLAHVHRRALESQIGGKFRYFNVGTGVGVSVKELIDKARQVTGCDIPASPGPRRVGDPPELYADPTKAMTELGWQPDFTDLKKTLETAWLWHKSHPNGYATERRV